MPKPQASEKTRTIRDYLSRFPDAPPKDLAERIRNETDFKKVTNDEVSKIKSAYRSQLKPQGHPEHEPQAVQTARPAAGAAPEPAQPAPSDNGTPRRQPGVAESVRLVHRLLADVGPRAARDVVDLVAAMGPDEANRLIDLLQEIDQGQEGAKGSKP